MVKQAVSRTQKRVEKKQFITVIIMLVIVAGGSFYLGMLFGRQGESLPVFVENTEKPKLPMVTHVKAPPKPADQENKEPDKLTFYDNLPKGKQAPLGSGINLPPVNNEVKQVQEPVQQVNAKLEKKPPGDAPSPPPVSTSGAFVVQIASFRTSQDADKLAERLKKYNLKTFQQVADLGEKGTWYRVLAGPYATRDDADSAARLLRENERLSTLVRQK